MVKRVHLLLLALALSFVLAACGGATTPSSSGGTAATAAPAAGSGAAATAAPAAPAATTAPAATAAPTGEAVALTYLVDDSQNTKDTAQALVDAYTALHPNVTINVETRPGGTEGDNLVKTRLATGEMADVFWYNSGSLLQALHPADTLVDISQEPFIANIDPTFLPTVSQNGQIFGVPSGTAMGGGILYNKKLYQQLGLSVPTTWAEFEANNDKIKAAGKTAVIATYGDTWTSQLFVLADYYNVQLAQPNFAQDYTANKLKIATTPPAVKGFEYLQEANQKGWYEKDYATTKFEQGLKLLADGEGAHFPMLSFGLSTIAANSPDKVNDIGFFGIPGTDASKAGATIWMPAGTYIPKTSKHVAEAKDFLGFIASTAGVDAITAKVAPQGPYLIKGTKLPDNVLPAVKDIAGYIDSGKAAPALEFFSPVKGPNLEQICVAVGSGQMTPQDAAANYDKDVEKQAKQLGLPGW
ncbi:MAG: extracellular solute-binding protein [Kouleothrix sp.]|nr:extracellular solute-binding protein [Kouleothrix sp.]